MSVADVAAGRASDREPHAEVGAQPGRDLRAQARGHLGRYPAAVSTGLVLVAQTLLLLPLLQSPFVFDDEINSYFSGSRRVLGESYFGAATGVVQIWWSDFGRVFPISFYQGYGQFELIHDRLTYKLLLLLFTLVATACVAWLLRAMGASVWASALTILLAAVAMQFRLYHDPVLAYTGLQQLVLIEICVSLVFFLRWLERGRRRDLAVAVVAFAVACLTYESACLLSAMHGALALRHHRRLRPALQAASPVVAVSVVLLGLAAYLRQQAPPGPYATTLGTEALATARAQLAGAVPLDFALNDPNGIFVTESLVSRIDTAAVLVGLAVAVTAGLLLWRTTAGDRAQPFPVSGVVSVGALLWLLAALPIGLAPKYQAELEPGLAHIPVFLEYFGFAMIAVGLLHGLVRRVSGVGLHGPPVIAVVAVLFGQVGAFTYVSNVAVVETLAPLRHAREVDERALQAGLLDAVPAGSLLVVEADRAWQDPGFYAMHTGRVYRVAAPDSPSAMAARSARVPCSKSAPGTYAVSAVRVADEPIGMLVGCLGPHVDGAPAVHLSDPLPPDSVLALRSGPRTAGAQGVGPDHITVLPPGVRGRVLPLTVPRGETATSAEVLEVEAGVSSVFLRGCSPKEGAGEPGSGAETWNWCGAQAGLALVNRSGDVRTVLLSFALASAAPATSVVEVAGRRTVVRTGATSVPFRRLLELPPGETVVRFRTDSQRLPAPGDPRELRLRIQDLVLGEEQGPPGPEAPQR